MVHIPYRGSAPAFTDLMGDQVQFMGESIPQAASYHKQGKVRALAVTSKERNPALPDIPTVIESGFKGFEVVGFYGFLAPAGLPKDVTAKLSDAFKQVMANPDIRNRMVTQGADPAFMGSEELASSWPRKHHAGPRPSRPRARSSIECRAPLGVLPRVHEARNNIWRGCHR